MFSIPPYILLFVFGAFLAGFLFFAVANIVLLARFGAKNAFGFAASFTFIAGTAVILLLTWNSVADIDWKTPVPIVSFPSSMNL